MSLSSEIIVPCDEIVREEIDPEKANARRLPTSFLDLFKGIITSSLKQTFSEEIYGIRKCSDPHRW